MHNEDIVIPEGVDRIIKELCADYARRAGVMQSKSAPFNVIMEYRFLNYRIMNAAIEIAGSRDAVCFIKDIGDERGYATSDLWVLSESEYKTRKIKVKLNIARRLSLI